MTEDELKSLIKQEIRESLQSGEIDEGFLDRIKAKAKGAVSSVAGKVTGKQSDKSEVQIKSVTDSYLNNISKELQSFRGDLNKMFNLQNKNYNEFVKEFEQYYPEIGEMVSNIIKVSKSLKDKVK